ncbi:hypothetical protein C1646_686443 [Rhizophagus diaphanus]|nr:hypothetical protein C1646_686443 [Rhizophagus diaphanus] [Rhizophagus sp. MUCL 43196]
METPDLEISFVLISSVFNNNLGFIIMIFLFLEKKKQFKCSNLYFNIDFSGKRKKKKGFLIFYSPFSFYFPLIKKENFFFRANMDFM